MREIPEDLQNFWKEREEVEAFYLLPTSTSESKDVLLWISHSPLSYFQRLDFYYPREKRREYLKVFPITREEFEKWPQDTRKRVMETLKKSRLLWKRSHD